MTVYRWVRRLTPLLVEAAWPCRRRPGARWCVEEAYVKVAGQWTCRCRAVDQHGQVIDEFLPEACHVDAAREDNRIEADHGRSEARLPPMRGLKRLR